jgi:hypothetical protein
MSRSFEVLEIIAFYPFKEKLLMIYGKLGRNLATFLVHLRKVWWISEKKSGNTGLASVSVYPAAHPFGQSILSS